MCAVKIADQCCLHRGCAVQVVHDLGALLEATKIQQTAIEARVTTMQSTIMQLLPVSSLPISCTT